MGGVGGRSPPAKDPASAGRVSAFYTLCAKRKVCSLLFKSARLCLAPTTLRHKSSLLGYESACARQVVRFGTRGCAFRFAHAQIHAGGIYPPAPPRALRARRLRVKARVPFFWSTPLPVKICLLKLIDKARSLSKKKPPRECRRDFRIASPQKRERQTSKKIGFSPINAINDIKYYRIALLNSCNISSVVVIILVAAE